MKRFLLVVFIFAIIFSVMGCGEKNSVEGTWTSSITKLSKGQGLFDYSMWYSRGVPGHYSDETYEYDGFVYTDGEWDNENEPTYFPAITTDKAVLTLTINADGSFSKKLNSTQTYELHKDSLKTDEYGYYYTEETLGGMMADVSYKDITPSQEDGSLVVSSSGSWYANGEEKFILNQTQIGSYELTGDLTPSLSNDFSSAELTLIDNLMYADFNGNLVVFTRN